MGDVVSFGKKSDEEELLEYAAQQKYKKIVLLGFNGDSWEPITTGVEGVCEFIGLLEMLKMEMFISAIAGEDEDE